MEYQNAYRKHKWEIVGKVTLDDSGSYTETELCSKCKAKRTVLYPFGMILRSIPYPQPRAQILPRSGQSEGVMVEWGRAHTHGNAA